MPEQPTPLDCWAIVEVMGHKQFAGHVTEQVLGAAALIRVDVPATEHHDHNTAEYSKLIGVASIYMITPCTEEIARAAAQRLERFNNPIPVDLPTPRQIAAAAAVVEDAEFEDPQLDDDRDYDGVLG